MRAIYCRTALLLLALPLMLAAAPYDVNWHTADGGGGVSTGGTYRLGGTAGQPEAGVMSGGSYRIQGGFWAAPPRIPGDVDGDGQVNVLDIVATVNAFGRRSGQPGWNAGADFDGDGEISVLDVVTTVTAFGTIV